MRDVIDRMQAANRSRDYLLKVLKLWVVVEEAGYAVEDVKSFTFDPQFLSKEEKRKFVVITAQWRGPKPLDGNDYHNCVRLHTGELKPIPLTKRPRDDLTNANRRLYCK